MIEPGKRIPAFKLPDQSGKEKSLKDLSGPAGLVIYVYPKDNTPGCSLEAQEFRVLAGKFRKNGFNVVGLSKDSVKSHCGFSEKYALDFPLLSDPGATLITALGAFGEKKMYGKTVKGIIRSTVVTDAAGKVLKTYGAVKAAGHAETVLSDIGNL